MLTYPEPFGPLTRFILTKVGSVHLYIRDAIASPNQPQRGHPGRKNLDLALRGDSTGFTAPVLLLNRIVLLQMTLTWLLTEELSPMHSILCL